jgi:hypothetical protein
LSSGHGAAFLADRRLPLLSSHNTFKTHGFHEPRHGASRNRDALARELLPDLPNAIDIEVLLEHPADLNRQLGIALGPSRQAIRIGLSPGVLIPGGRGDLQHPAHRLDPEVADMGFHEADHFLNGRSSSAAVK